jgi:phage terminase large subunit-like protein
MVRFGHLQYEKDVHNYDGHEFHRICVDQVEQLTRTQYEYLFSFLRRSEDYPIPCGIRSSANPAANWVKQRFITDEAIRTLKQFTAHDPSPEGMMFQAPCNAVFVPARIADNPTLAVNDYVERLTTRLGAALAARLANGDWSAFEGAIVDPEFLRYYTTRGAQLTPYDSTGSPCGISVDERNCRRFATVDTAGTSKQKAAEDKGKPASWSVCAIWDYAPQIKLLFLRHIWREQVDWSQLKRRTAEVLKEWHVPQVLIEQAHFGPALAEELRNHVGTVRLVSPHLSTMRSARIGAVESAKYERATSSGFLTKLETGEILIPDVQTVAGVSKWMPEFESELLGWTGRPDETADQIDVCSHAVASLGGARGRTFGGIVDTRRKPRRVI